MANAEKELSKFLNDPKYREKVLARIHKEEDNEYNRRIKTIETDRNKLSKKRTNEITRIYNSRWEKYANGKLLVNRTEGKIKFNNSEALFSSIQGAEINIMSGYRIVTTEQSSSKSKKSASLGGAVAGGILLGPVGAVVGGVGLGKTKTKGTGSTVSNSIPTCTHLGVLVNIDGFVSEIVFISSQVDQSSLSFSRAQSEAQNLIAQLGVLAKTAVPKSFLKPEEEVSVKAIDREIEIKGQELQTAISDKPVYRIPSMYKSEEYQEMTDEEYLQHLANTDTLRMEERRAKEAEFKQEQIERKLQKKQNTLKETEEVQRSEEKTIKSQFYKPNLQKVDYKVILKAIGTVIYKVLFWFFSILLALLSLAGFMSGGMVSGLLFLLTALFINPTIEKFIQTKLFTFPKWIVLVVLVVGFFVGILTFPADTDTSNSGASSTVKTVELKS